MEISETDLAEAIAAGVARARALDRQEAPRVGDAPIPQTSLAVYVADPDVWTLRFHRWHAMELGGQQTAFQAGQEAGFPSRIARQLIRARLAVRVDREDQA